MMQSAQRKDGVVGEFTEFVPAELVSPETLEQQIALVARSPIVATLCDVVDGFLFILNRQRQVLAANPQALRRFHADSIATLLGRRPGDAMACLNRETGPGGCGTGSVCATCNAVRVILDSQRTQKPVTGEFRLWVEGESGNDAVDFRVRASSIDLGDMTVTMLVLNDISGQKRREAMERVFFHDIRNTLGGLLGWSQLLERGEAADPRQAAERIAILTKRLLLEMEEHRQLLQGETGELETSFQRASVNVFLGMLESLFSLHEVSQGKQLKVGRVADEETVMVDSILLVRVLTNMVKNAFEAVEPGAEVHVRFERRDGRPMFNVWNPGSIPPTIARQIFRRSFSTKDGIGRGLGTFAMKLFGERYLGGKVSFTSSHEQGTTFQILLPEDGDGSA